MMKALQDPGCDSVCNSGVESVVGGPRHLSVVTRNDGGDELMVVGSISSSDDTIIFIYCISLTSTDSLVMMMMMIHHYYYYYCRRVVINIQLPNNGSRESVRGGIGATATTDLLVINLRCPLHLPYLCPQSDGPKTQVQEA